MQGPLWWIYSSLSAALLLGVRGRGVSGRATSRWLLGGQPSRRRVEGLSGATDTAGGPWLGAGCVCYVCVCVCVRG